MSTEMNVFLSLFLCLSVIYIPHCSPKWFNSDSYVAFADFPFNTIYLLYSPCSTGDTDQDSKHRRGDKDKFKDSLSEGQKVQHDDSSDDQ